MALGKPKLAAKTPDSEDTNALLVDGAHDRLIKYFRDPKLSNEHVAIVRFAVDEIVTKEGGAEQAKISIRHIELPTGDDLETTTAALLSAYQERTKQTMLPGLDGAAMPLDLSGLDPKKPGE